MNRILHTGLLLSLGISSSWLVACGGDDGDDKPTTHNDAGPHADGGTASDAGHTNLDSGTNIDSGLKNDAGETPVDSGTSDAATTKEDASTGTALTATMTKDQETAVPACPAGASAAGTAAVEVSEDNSTINVTIIYAGLSGAPTGGHIHAGATGVSGPVVLPFAGSLASPITQTLRAADYHASAGAPADFAAFVASLKAGNAYVNLHTQACAGGEIRGQIH